MFLQFATDDDLMPPSIEALLSKPRSFATRARGLLRAACLGLLALGCEEPPSEQLEATEKSPNATILPAPLSSTAMLGRHKPDGAVQDAADDPAAAARATPLRDDEQPPLDVPTARDMVGVELDAVWRWFDLPNPAGVPESDAAAIRAHKQKASLEVSVTLSFSGKMRFRLDSAAFALPPGSELRASPDSYGYTLIWPDRRTYRVVTPGMASTLLAERRADAVPLVAAKVRPEADGMLLDHATRRVELSTAKGRLVLDQAEIVPADGRALCRLLVELIAAKPDTPVCGQSRVPLRAEYHWAGGGRLAFEAAAFTRRQDLPVTELSLVPDRAIFKVGELPPHSTSVILTPPELSAWRLRAAPGKTQAGAPAQGLIAENHSYLLQYLMLEGVPVAWVPPGSQVEILGPKAGRYSVGWRDFYGSEIAPASVVQLPARVSVGERADARAEEP